jgi:CBS domain-containing protein
MTATIVYASRLLRLPLVAADGATIGRIDDIVFVPSGDGPPRVVGFVALVQRRRIFVNAARVGEIAGDGVRMRSGNIDVRHFEQRGGELRAREIFGRRAGDAYVVDIAIEPVPGQSFAWQLVSVALGRRSRLRGRRNPKVVSWRDTWYLFDGGPLAAEVAELRELHPSDAADRVRSMPLARLKQITAAMDDEHLADVLAELPDDEQVGIIEGLGMERAVAVIEHLDPDAAADLLAEMPEDERMQLLAAMDDEDATPVRRLLSYGQKSAGGLMTSDPLILPRHATVADALAVMRDDELEVALAAQVFVVEPPTSTPTGRFVGVVGFQRLLREAPWMRLDSCVDDEPEFLRPDAPDDEVSARLAAYDLVAIAVCDEAQRLIGAVTVDDVIDHMLPPTWRRVRRGVSA